jgi:hypothetical protein
MSYIGAEPTTAAFPFDQFSGNGSTTAFTLTYAPASTTSIIVAISGVVQNPNLYSVIGTTLTFSPAPPSGTNNISVLYLGLPVITPAGTGDFTTINNSGNLTFTGTGNRIRGDFSNATIANRVMFQTSTANSATVVEFLPSGTGTVSGVNFGSSSDLANTSILSVSSLSTDARFNAGFRGTGTFLPMTFYTGGSERMRVDTSGNVGIGTSSPAYRLQVNASGGNGISLLGDTNNEASVLFGDSGSAVIGRITYDNSTDSMRLWTNAAERARIDASGNVGIGTTSPGGALSVYRATGTAQWSIQAFNNANTGGSGFWQRANGQHEMVLRDSSNNANYITNSSNNLEIVVNGSERARIDSSGNLLVGTTSANESFANGFIVQGVTKGYVATSMSASTNAVNTYHVYSTGAGTYRFYVGMGGTVFATSTTISAISDQRLKENVQDIDVGLDKIMALKPRKFDWKEGKGKDIKGDRGWIAQEFEQVFPEMVGTWRDEPPEGEEPYKSVGADLIPVLVKAIQELNAKVEAQAAEIAALKGAA